MKSITIHGIDEPLEKLIKSRAQAEGISINKTIKSLLEQSLGVKPRGTNTHHEEFKEFCGIWDEEDIESFEQNISDLRQIEAEDWK